MCRMCATEVYKLLSMEVMSFMRLNGAAVPALLCCLFCVNMFACGAAPVR